MLSRSEEKLVRGLARRKVREKEGLFLAEGVRVVEELLRAGLVLRLALISSSLEDTERGRSLAAGLHRATEVRRVDGGLMDELADTTTNQGVLVVAETPVVGLDAVEVGEAFTALVLDAVQDPGNLGTLVRSAVAFGCDLVACLPGTVDAWNPKAVRASAGMVFRLPVAQVEPEELASWLGRRDVMFLGADAQGRRVDRLALPRRVALAVGNEGGGLSGYIRSRVDAEVSVPMSEEAESLNVAVAAGILLYVITGSRR